MLVGEYVADGVAIEIFNRIDDIDVDIWNSTLAERHPLKTHGFMRACEETIPKRQYRYLRVSPAAARHQTCGLIFATQEVTDALANAAPRLKSRLETLKIPRSNFGYLPVAMLGSYETSGRHWWFSDAIPKDRYIQIISSAMELAFPHAKVTVIRDLRHDGADHDVLRSRLLACRFHPAMNYPLATIPIQGLSWSSHCLRLKAHCRKVFNRAMTQLRLAHWRIVHYIDHPPPLEALYELYLNTHRKAREFSREALPMSFFESVQAHCRVVTSVLYDQRGQARSFIFSGVSDTVLHPFAFGRDYRTEDRVNAYCGNPPAFNASQK